MRAHEFLFEEGLKSTGLRKAYVLNLISLITNNQPVAITPKFQKTYGTEIVFPKSVAKILKASLDGGGGRLSGKGYIILDPEITKLPISAEKFVPLTAIEKSPEIKGKEVDYNIGDIGEIALGISAGAKFLKLGQQATAIEFVDLANKMSVQSVVGKKGQVLNSLQLTYTGSIRHASGKTDVLELKVKAPGRSVKAFVEFMKAPGDVPDDVKGTILSSIMYSGEAEKIKYGLDKTANDPNRNTIEVTSDGTGDQKGTKADLVMDIDGERINLLSAKTGPSQLGQASGHDWKKQVDFFRTVFQVDVSKFEKTWGETNKEHLATLHDVWQTAVIPKVLRLTGGDSIRKEIELVRSIAGGLIKYSNNVNVETGEVETIDIIKLIVDPGTPGYSLLRIDAKLIPALEKTDLRGEATKNGYGIQVLGRVNGTDILLFKARSYYSPAGDVVRTIIEGGDLLDQLAVVVPTQQPAPGQGKLPTIKKNVGIKQVVPSRSGATQPTPALNVSKSQMGQDPV
jgi:hypothetical protein